MIASITVMNMKIVHTVIVRKAFGNVPITNVFQIVGGVTKMMIVKSRFCKN